MLRYHRIVLLALVLFGLLPSVGKAAQGGFITLVNGTPYNWRSSNPFARQMNAWSFPEVITAGSTATLYVEWSDSTPVTNDHGVVTFTLEGTALTFQLEATAASGPFDLRVTLTSFSTLGNPQGSVIDLGWSQNGYVNFILAGEAGSFTSSRMPDAWMHASLGLLGSRSLRHLCVPGSHDAGMSTFSSGTSFARPCSTVTQTKSVLNQLHAGARYFDIRPVIRGGQFYTGHYSPTPTAGWQGATGQSLDSIIDDVNSYTAANQELVVLYLSHDLSTDLGSLFPPLTQADWNLLLSKLLRLNNRFMASNPTTVDLTTLTLGDFIRSQAAVVVVVQPSDSTITLGSFANQGFYTPQSFPVFDSFANTDLVGVMQTDQLANKLPVQRPDPDARSFLLSWTLTQSVAAALRCPVYFPPDNTPPIFYDSVLDLAAKAYPALYQNVLPVCNRRTYPNILDIDNVQSPDVAALAMAVNSKASWDKPQGYLIYKGPDPDNSIYVAHSSDSDLGNTKAWSRTRMSPAIQTSATPGAVFFAGGLYVFYKGAGTDSRIFVAQPAGGNIQDGGSWHAEPMKEDRTIKTSAAPAVAVFNNIPYLFFKGAGSDNNVYIARPSGNPGEGKSWSAHPLNPAILTSTAPAVVTFNGALYLFYKGASDNNIYIARSTGGDVFDGSTWSPNLLTHDMIKTNAAPGAVVYNGALYLFYKEAAGTNIFIAHSAGDVSDGTTWSPNRLIPGINTFVQPKPVVVGDSLYLFYKGSGDTFIWIGLPGADPLNGNGWSNHAVDSTLLNTTTGPGAASM
jgi:acyl dehydratase